LAHKGSIDQISFKDVRELNKLTRTNYADLRKDLGLHIRPIIIASDYEYGFEGVGSTFTLYNEDGSTEKTVPPPPSYEMFKSLSHVTLGICSIISPYFKCPSAAGWENKLRNFGQKIDATINNFIASGLEEKVVKYVTEMLNISKEYIDNCIKNQSVDSDSFKLYSHKIIPHIHKSMANAARIQVEADIPQLLRWHDKLGEKWKDLYVVIPTVWPVSGDNPRERMLALILPNPETQIIKTMNQSSEQDLFDTLGRVVGDRAIAALVFGSASDLSRDSQLALSTPRDLVSSACCDAIVNYLRQNPEKFESFKTNLTTEAKEMLVKFERGELNVGKEYYSKPLNFNALIESSCSNIEVRPKKKVFLIWGFYKNTFLICSLQ